MCLRDRCVYEIASRAYYLDDVTSDSRAGFGPDDLKARAQALGRACMPGEFRARALARQIIGRVP